LTTFVRTSERLADERSCASVVAFSRMAERQTGQTLFADGRHRGFVVAVVVTAAVSAFVGAFAWAGARDLDSRIRVAVGLGAAAVGVLLVLGVMWATHQHRGGQATERDSGTGRALERTLQEKSSPVALDFTRVHDGRPVTGAEWLQMATEFQNVRDLAVRAEWHKDPDRESWSLAGSMPAALDHTDVLCRRAGAMLLASPRVATALSERVRAHEDPVDRWLQFIREQPQTRMQVLDMSHTIALPVEGGYIRDVPTVSARACIACSADEA
jgi:hypothetical protein